MGKNVTRLYEQFQPEHYNLAIHPDKTSMTFTGSLELKGKKVNRPTKRITLHQKGLHITTAEIVHHDKKGDRAVTVTRINNHESYDEVRLHTESEVYPGSYTIKLSFQGDITKQMNGIYPCFFEQDGRELQLIATQFESHHAREVFPCIDEPEAKATFDLTLSSPEGETVIANTPAKSQTKESGMATTIFETTPRMSTYLLAFVIGELRHKEARTKSGVTVRAYATPNNIDYVDFSLECAVRTLDFYNEYFAIPYPLEKCDMIALPDFASGAMENWGCITYREAALLVDPKNTSLSAKQYVAMVVAHELAHQWFGNLVTMRWWTDLWLNEGFASWIEYLAVDTLFPEWQMWTQFAVDEQHRAFRLDALEHTHPVEVPVRHPDEIRTIFDTISYSKGASVIHMLHDFLSADDFRDGLRHYLKLHSYGNTDTVDLWAALEEISGKPVKDFMAAWTGTPGFPLLNISKTADHISLSQERFMLNPESKTDQSQIWPIPLLSTEADYPDLFDSRTVSLPPPKNHLKMNRLQSGFYRTNYDRKLLTDLTGTISSMSALDRLGLLSDVFENAKAGRTRTVDALELLQTYESEDNNAVWDVIAGGIGGVRNVMDDEALREAMKPFIRSITRLQLERLGWEKTDQESHFDQLLRPTIIAMSAAADTQEVVDECLKRFDNMEKPEDIDPDLRGAVYSTAVRLRNDPTTYDKLFNMHEASQNSEERTTIAAALTNFKDPALAQRALDTIKTKSVRLQDVSYWVAYSFMNRHAKDMTWEWMKQNWDWLGENLGTDLSFSRFPVYAANAFSHKEFIQEFEDFFMPRKTPAFERAVNQGIEILQWQSAWRERDYEQVLEYFNQYNQQM